MWRKNSKPPVPTGETVPLKKFDSYRLTILNARKLLHFMHFEINTLDSEQINGKFERGCPLFVSAQRNGPFGDQMRTNARMRGGGRLMVRIKHCEPRYCLWSMSMGQSTVVVVVVVVVVQ